MIVKLTPAEVASAITQAVGRKMGLPKGTTVKVRLNIKDAEADIGETLITDKWEPTNGGSANHRKDGKTDS
jgi:hypothetical protein